VCLGIAGPALRPLGKSENALASTAARLWEEVEQTPRCLSRPIKSPHRNTALTGPDNHYLSRRIQNRRSPTPITPV
jgi:hypothetical protein